MRIRQIATLTVILMTSPNLFAAGPEFSWVTRAGGTAGSPTAAATAVDSHGNIFVTGTFAGTTTFGTTVLNCSSGFAGFISKLDPLGNWLWTRAMMATSSTEPSLRPCALAIDPNGNLIVTGETPSTTTSIAAFGTNQVNLASCEIFAAKYDSQGECLWARSTGGCDQTYDHGVAVDRLGNIYVGGETLRSTNFLLLKLDASGNELMRINSDSGWLCGHKVAVDAAGNIYACGALNPPVQLQGHTVGSVPYREAYIAKFDPSGRAIWIRESAGNTGPEDTSWAFGLATDSQTNVLVCGNVYGTNLWGSSFPTATAGTSKTYVLKPAPGGSNIWFKVADAASGLLQPGACDLALIGPIMFSSAVILPARRSSARRAFRLSGTIIFSLPSAIIPGSSSGHSATAA